MTKKSSLYFGLVDVDDRPSFKYSQVRAETNQINYMNSQSDYALRIDKDEEIMDNSECPEHQDLPVEDKIIRLPSWLAFRKIEYMDLRTVVYVQFVDSCRQALIFKSENFKINSSLN